MGTVLYIILAVLVVFIGIILLRTLAFRPHKEEAVTAEPVELNEEKIIADMADMIRCKTVSNRDHSLVDWAEFDRFQALLQERFPRIHAAATLEKLGKTGLLYHLNGKLPVSFKVGIILFVYGIYKRISQ